MEIQLRIAVLNRPIAAAFTSLRTAGEISSRGEVGGDVFPSPPRGGAGEEKAPRLPRDGPAFPEVGSRRTRRRAMAVPPNEIRNESAIRPSVNAFNLAQLPPAWPMRCVKN